MYEVDEWSITREDNLYLVYPTEEGKRSAQSRHFATEKEAIEYAETYAAIEEE